jgi:hypothetical protein
VLCISVQSAIFSEHFEGFSEHFEGFSEHFEGFSEHGIFHGIAV